MAKKGQAVQLQVEVSTDEEFEKLLQRDGLIVVDVYSEWCGPCSGMSATLKKLKLEIGGDLLQLAMAKSDNITPLARFRNKSEPTWMLIANGKMVNFMFGANAPKLTQIIIDELKKEQEARDGMRERVQIPIDQLTNEEMERVKAAEEACREAVEKEKAEVIKKLRDRLTAEANNILDNLSNLGVILVFSHAKDQYMSVFNEFLGEAGLTIVSTEKAEITEEMLRELFYFEEYCPFSDEDIEHIVSNENLTILLKPMHTRELKDLIEEVLCEMIYGPSKSPPGDPDSPANRLSNIRQETEDEQEEIIQKIAVWTPPTNFVKATALKLFYPKQAERYIIPEPEEVPVCAAIFEAYRTTEVAKVMNKYRNGVISYGFFTSEVPKKAKLIATNIKEFQAARVPDAKLVIELNENNTESVFAFAQMRPCYMSANVKVGKEDCKTFFPLGYEPLSEEDNLGQESETATVEELVIAGGDEEAETEGQTTEELPTEEGIVEGEGEVGEEIEPSEIISELDSVPNEDLPPAVEEVIDNSEPIPETPAEEQ